MGRQGKCLFQVIFSFVLTKRNFDAVSGMAYDIERSNFIRYKNFNWGHQIPSREFKFYRSIVSLRPTLTLDLLANLTFSQIPSFCWICLELSEVQTKNVGFLRLFQNLNVVNYFGNCFCGIIPNRYMEELYCFCWINC